MNLLRSIPLILLLSLAQSAHAGAVYRCAKPSGAVYYSDKGCPPTDKPASTDDLKGGSMSVVGSAKGGAAGKAPAQVGGGGLNQQYIRRAQGGAARAEQQNPTQ